MFFDDFFIIFILATITTTAKNTHTHLLTYNYNTLFLYYSLLIFQSIVHKLETIDWNRVTLSRSMRRGYFYIHPPRRGCFKELYFKLNPLCLATNATFILPFVPFIAKWYEQ